MPTFRVWYLLSIGYFICDSLGRFSSVTDCTASRMRSLRYSPGGADSPFPSCFCLLSAFFCLFNLGHFFIASTSNGLEGCPWNTLRWPDSATRLSGCTVRRLPTQSFSHLPMTPSSSSERRGGKPWRSTRFSRILMWPMNHASPSPTTCPALWQIIDATISFRWPQSTGFPMCCSPTPCRHMPTGAYRRLLSRLSFLAAILPSCGSSTRRLAQLSLLSAHINNSEEIST